MGPRLKLVDRRSCSGAICAILMERQKHRNRNAAQNYPPHKLPSDYGPLGTRCWCNICYLNFKIIFQVEKKCFLLTTGISANTLAIFNIRISHESNKWTSNWWQRTTLGWFSLANTLPVTNKWSDVSLDHAFILNISWEKRDRFLIYKDTYIGRIKYRVDSLIELISGTRNFRFRSIKT